MTARSTPDSPRKGLTTVSRSDTEAILVIGDGGAWEFPSLASIPGAEASQKARQEWSLARTTQSWWGMCRGGAEERVNAAMPHIASRRGTAFAEGVRHALGSAGWAFDRERAWWRRLALCEWALQRPGDTYQDPEGSSVFASLLARAFELEYRRGGRHGILITDRPSPSTAIEAQMMLRTRLLARGRTLIAQQDEKRQSWMRREWDDEHLDTRLVSDVIAWYQWVLAVCGGALQHGFPQSPARYRAVYEALLTTEDYDQVIAHHAPPLQEERPSKIEGRVREAARGVRLVLDQWARRYQPQAASAAAVDLVDELQRLYGTMVRAQTGHEGAVTRSFGSDFDRYAEFADGYWHGEEVALLLPPLRAHVEVAPEPELLEIY